MALTQAQTRRIAFDRLSQASAHGPETLGQGAAAHDLDKEEG